MFRPSSTVNCTQPQDHPSQITPSRQQHSSRQNRATAHDQPEALSFRPGELPTRPDQTTAGVNLAELQVKRGVSVSGGKWRFLKGGLVYDNGGFLPPRGGEVGIDQKLSAEQK